VLLLAAAIRAPFWDVARRASVDGDTAIIGLMAEHPARSLTMWAQPYGSPLDAWVAAPFVAALGPTPLAVRIPYALLSLALVAAAFALGERVRPGAGLPAGVLMACPSAYLLLLSALPPPLYPTTLVLLAVVLLLAGNAADELTAGRQPAPARMAALGALAGLAAWTHLMSVATLAAAFMVFARCAWRARAPSVLMWAAVPFLAASAPWWARALREPAATEVLGIAHEGEAPLAHARGVARRLHVPVSALLGGWSPLTADESDRTVTAPGPLRVALTVAWLVALGAGVTLGRDRPITGMLAGAALLTIAAFPFPVRSDPHTLRFLTPIAVPLAVLAGVGAVRLAGARRAWLAVVPLCAAQLWTSVVLVTAWRAAGTAALVPDCGAVLAALRGRGLTRAYASYHTAYCLTYTSGETVVASPPWNERFYGYPMPYLDDVRSAPSAAWVLVPGVDFGLPAPRTFESKVAGIGGRHVRIDAPPGVVYADFVPPFSSTIVAGRVAGPAGDGDVTTRVLQSPGGAAVFAVVPPLAVAGLTLLAAREPPGLPRAMDIEVSGDGATFERIGRRRRGRETVDLAWIDGHPQFLIDDLAFAVPLDGRTVSAVRIVPMEGTAWAVSEVLLHPAPEAAPPPRTGDAGALYRSLVAPRRP
jgi:hypothetical protein